MSGEAHEIWLRMAVDQLERGLSRAAIDSLRRYLAVEPDSAQAHAVLALALYNTKRLTASAHEARLALQLDPESIEARRALALAAMGARRFSEAQKLLDEALAFDPESVHVRLGLARLGRLRGDWRAEREALDAARRLAPEEPGVIVDQGSLELREGNTDGAEKLARAALALDPENISGQVLLGRVMLKRGRVEEARELAVTALRAEASSREALLFLVEAKVRANPLMGMWWRWNTWMNELGSRSSVIVLVAAFLIQRVARQIAGDLGATDVSELIGYAWLGVVAYTWIAPGVFHRMLARELQDVRLRPDFSAPHWRQARESLWIPHEVEPQRARSAVARRGLGGARTVRCRARRVRRGARDAAHARDLGHHGHLSGGLPPGVREPRGAAEDGRERGCARARGPVVAPGFGDLSARRQRLAAVRRGAHRLQPVALRVLGPLLEELLGTARFVVLFALCGIVGSVASGLAHPFVGGVGASGAIWGLMTAWTALAIWPHLLIPRPWRATFDGRCIQAVGLNLGLSTLPGIDLMAHLGGGVAGLLLVVSGLITLGAKPLLGNEPESPGWRRCGSCSRRCAQCRSWPRWARR